MDSPNSLILLFSLLVLAFNLLSHVDAARQLGMPTPVVVEDNHHQLNKEKEVVMIKAAARENINGDDHDEMKNLPTNLNIPFVPPLPDTSTVPLPQIFPPFPFPPTIPQIPGIPPLPAYTIPVLPPFPPFYIPNIPFLNIPPPA